MKITHTGVVLTLEGKDRKLIADTIALLGKICDELGGYENRDNVRGWSCNLAEVAEAHDKLVELWLANNDNKRDYDFKTIGGE